MKNPIYPIVYDEDSSTSERIGMTLDDTLLTEQIVKMQRKGMNVRCSTSNIPINELQPDYPEENGLWQRLLDRYKSKETARTKK